MNGETVVTVLITTRNRKDELRRALKSAVGQTATAEVLVLDDGSTDGTAGMVRAEFPGVKLYRFEESKGLIVRRNEGARLAAGDIIFSIDDDAEFSTPHIVEQTLKEFDHPRVGAVAIPFIEPNKANQLLQRAPSADKIWATDSYIGTAHALRRDLFLKLDGYREHLVHQGEEGDYCIRMLDAGYFVRLGNADPIRHFESPKRDLQRMDFYGCRNSILFAWQNVPASRLPLHLAVTTFNCLRWTFAPGRFWTRVGGLATAFGNFARAKRSPVKMQTYYQWRNLRKSGPISLESVLS